MKKWALSLLLLMIGLPGLIASGQDTLTPKIAFMERSFDAGEVLEGTIIEHTYKVFNQGDAVLRISRVSPGWGCSVAEFDKAIPPGREGRIIITMNTMDKMGIINKSIGVFSNDPEKRNEHITFKASIKPIFSFTPSYFVTLTGEKGERKGAEVLIKSNLEKPLKIEPDGFTLEGKINFSLETVETGKLYRVVFRNNPGIEGIFNGQLMLKTNYTEKQYIKIRVNSRFN